MKNRSQLLDVSNIHKSHDNLLTLKNIALTLYQGEILCLLGPSGCGKTTLLRIIAGLEKPDQGSVCFDGIDLATVPPFRRKFSMMFQEFALFPHKNVYENIVFGLRMQKLEEDAVINRAEEMIRLVGLQGLENRDIADLSGGERQRVALARSLAPNPRLLMLDEPMGSLDRALRERLVLDLRQILKKVDVTTLFVTHDQNEAFMLADRIAVFNKGYIEQVGIPEELFKNPANEFVARFLGFQNLIPVHMNSDGSIDSVLGHFKPLNSSTCKNDNPQLLIRPEAARMSSGELPVKDTEIKVECRVIDCRFQGANYQVQVSMDKATNLVFHLPSDTIAPAPGEILSLVLNISAMTLI